MKRSQYYVDTKIGGKKTIYVKGQYWDWNSVYHTYNSRRTNDLLTWKALGVKSTPAKRKR